MQDWGERRGNPSRRPVCLTCPHEFQVNARMPSAWMFVRLSVNKAGLPKQMILVGISEKCAANDDATLLREGFADLRRARVQDAGGSGGVRGRQLTRCLPRNGGRNFQNCHHGGSLSASLPCS